MMPSDDEVTVWVSRLCEGDERAPQVIWEHYFAQLVRLAVKELDGLPRREADEEDVALSAMNTFFVNARAGRFPRLDDRTDLWKLLVKITARKAAAQRRRHFAKKRGEGKVRGESAFDNASGSHAAGGIDQVLGCEPTPQLAAMTTETCRRLLEQLDEESLRAVAIQKLQGQTNLEIADQLDCALRTVERKLRRIRDLWSKEDKE